jgi:disulfide bond formation protein DsbB
MAAPAMNVFFALLTVVADVIVLASVATWLWSRSSPRGKAALERLRLWATDGGLLLGWSIALVATLGSLYYSEIANFTPCKLCWYQRIAMYPQAIVLGIAALRNDHHIRRYVLPIVSIGAAISIYHYLLERFPSLESAGSCDPTAPCTTVWVWEFHFVSIPFMALSGFAAIAVLLMLSPTQNDQRREG